ncbi:MAG: TldD/PmbA family protein [Deltaproteobacteria bacterium]|nr:TldD/PmbA family protein [Deltaproteobacteria bacterium]
MLSPSTLQNIIGLGLSRGADFAEVFAEETGSGSVELLDGKIDRITSGIRFGVGVRLIYGAETFYGHSNDPAEDVLLRLTENLARQGAAGGPAPALKASSLEDHHPVRQDPLGVPKDDRVHLLRRLDAAARAQGQAIRQVGASLAESRRQILIANSEGLLIEDARNYSRMRVGVIADTGDGPQNGAESPGALGGWEVFEGMDMEHLAADAARRAVVMAQAGYLEGGMMPVVLGNGFGGVIFHEACGHPLETEAIRKNASPFAGKIGQQVAQSVLTAVDDGTIASAWGSFNVDDEGTPPQRTVLIENGVLKSFLADRQGGKLAGAATTGSARRENYKFAPVARMRNTFIAPGPHSVEAMIASIDNGLYAKKMGGGSVDPATGEFNFAVQEGYRIRKGKIAEAVRGATLIGKGHEVLPLISMVGADLELAAGMCGASSGWVPTTVGQPTLKIDQILVGGRR